MERMNYTIFPTESQLRKARSAVEGQLARFEHSVDVEDAVISLEFQDFERGASHVSTREEIFLTLNVDGSWEEEQELELSILRGLLEIEFRRKTSKEPEMFWEEIKLMAYVEKRVNKILSHSSEPSGSLEEWEKIREAIQDEGKIGEVYELSGKISGDIASKFEPDEILEWTLSDVIEAGNKKYSENI